MKVVQINAYYKHGSTGRLVSDLHEEMKKNDIDSYVVYGKKMTINNNEKYDENIILMSDKIDFFVHKYLYHIFGNALSYSTYKTYKLLKKLDEIKPDIIHLHNLHDYFINTNMLFKYIKKNDIKVIWTFHDCWTFTGHCTHFTDINCEKWKSVCKNCPKQRKGPRSLVFDRSKEFYKKKKELFNYPNMKIITVSKWLEGLVNESFLKGVKTETIYNWVDDEKFYPASDKEIEQFKNENNLKGKKIILGVAPAWTSNKGIEDFLELSKIIDDDMVIFLVGNNPQKKIGGEKHIYNIPDNVKMINATNDINKLRIIYSMADVFLNLSKQETFGLTTAEALACGTPAVVYELTACPEVVGIDKKAGECVKYNDNRIKNVNVSLNYITKNRDKYTDNCIKRVNDNFEKFKILGEYINAYKKMINYDAVKHSNGDKKNENEKNI